MGHPLVEGLHWPLHWILLVDQLATGVLPAVKALADVRSTQSLRRVRLGGGGHMRALLVDQGPRFIDGDITTHRVFFDTLCIGRDLGGVLIRGTLFFGLCCNGVVEGGFGYRVGVACDLEHLADDLILEVLRLCERVDLDFGVLAR